MASILVTGGAGFIGQRTCAALAREGHTVRVFDKLTAPVHPRGEWPACLREYECLHGDIRSPSDLLSALQGVQAVVHLAAYQDYLPDFSTFLATNTTATALLYELIVSHRLPVQKVVIASSQAVYGEGAYRCPEHGRQYPNARRLSDLRARQWDVVCPGCHGSVAWQPSDETGANPQNPYGISKFGQELIGIHLGRRYEIPTVGLRYSITQGAGQSFHNANSGICRIFCVCALLGKPLPVYEDGGQLRDYVHVDDVVSANLLSLKDPRMDYAVFNVGGSDAVSVMDYAELVRTTAGADVPIPVVGRFRVGDTRHVVSDTSRLRSLGWQPTRTLAQIIDEYLSWLRGQPLPEDVSGMAQARMQALGAIASVASPA
jgi:dTDP-L-rhamnose 4-epimerase